MQQVTLTMDLMKQNGNIEHWVVITKNRPAYEVLRQRIKTLNNLILQNNRLKNEFIRVIRGYCKLKWNAEGEFGELLSKVTTELREHPEDSTLKDIDKLYFNTTKLDNKLTVQSKKVSQQLILMKATKTIKTPVIQ